jgi:hypothetical protein
MLKFVWSDGDGRTFAEVLHERPCPSVIDACECISHEEKSVAMQQDRLGDVHRIAMPIEFQRCHVAWRRRRRNAET